MGKCLQEVDRSHHQRVHISTHIRAQSPNQDAEDKGHRRRHHRNQYCRAPARQDPRQHVPPEFVRAQRVQPRRRLRDVVPVLIQMIVRGEKWPERSDEEDNENNDNAPHRQPVGNQLGESVFPKVALRTAKLIIQQFTPLFGLSLFLLHNLQPLTPCQLAIKIQHGEDVSLLTPLPSLLAFGRSGLFGPPLCGGSAPATPPLLQHASSTWCDIRNRCRIDSDSPNHVPPAPSTPRSRRPCACPGPPNFNGPSGRAGPGGFPTSLQNAGVQIQPPPS